MDPEFIEPETVGRDPEFPWLGYEDEDEYEQDCN